MKKSLYDYCVENDQPHLLAQWDSRKNGQLKPNEILSGSRRKVWWSCEKGHEWLARVDVRVVLGRNCPYCANQKVLVGENDIATVAPEMAKLWHPTRNGTLKPADIAPGCDKKVWWRCEKGHEWQARVYRIKAGDACPYCSGRRAIPGETDIATLRPDLMTQWDFEKNSLDPTEVTIASHDKAWWKCELGHSWQAAVFSRTKAEKASGCPYCTGKTVLAGFNDLATLRPDLMTQWDFEKNSLDPTEVTIASHDKAWWKCELGHSWQAAVFSRTKAEKASGCPYCTGKTVLAGFNDLATLKPKLAEQWHQPLNGELKPEDVTLGSNKKVWWQCNDGHVWQAYIYARTKANGTGCPVCAGTVSRKRGERYAATMDEKR